MEDVHGKINQWKESIDDLYDLLENEVRAKHEIKQRDERNFGNATSQQKH